MIISHLKIIAFQTIINHSFWIFYIGGKIVACIKDPTKTPWVLGDTRFISRVELNMIFLTRSLHSFARYHVQH